MKYTVRPQGKGREADIQWVSKNLAALDKDKTFQAEIIEYRPWNPKKNDALNAMLRDIARWRYGDYDVPNREFERCVSDFKNTDVWPKESDSSPDYFTGEVLYRPLSRRKLSPEQQDGIMNWLTHYMTTNNVPSHHPQASGE